MIHASMNFNCQQCGKCCRDLVFRDHGVLRGLTLLPEETEHFREEAIEPYLGSGKHPDSVNFTILAYQLIETVCPHLAENMCNIYASRPVSCRQFPFSLDPDPEEGVLLGVDMNCPAAVELVNNCTGQIAFPDRDAAAKLFSLKQLAMKKPRQVWVYDLAQEKWVRYDRLD